MSCYLLIIQYIFAKYMHEVSLSGVIVLKTDRQTDRQTDRIKTGIDTVLLWSKERLP